MNEGTTMSFQTSCPPGPAVNPDERALEEELERFRRDYQAVRREIGQVIVGQDEVVDGALAALLIGGHVLLEGVPGLGKTMLVRTIADALHLKFQRIQFTPDLMPADVIGTNIVAETADGRRQFQFQPGPVFANVLLADEINRATPKTQSALLEAMAERHVTVAGQSHPVPQPFVVLATQNPLEMEGTYPLPEAQLDRFCFKLLVRFPAAEDLDAIVHRTTDSREPRARPVLDGERIRAMIQLARQVPLSAEVRAYAIAVLLATHPEQPRAPEITRRYVRYGASPRGLQAMVLAAKIRAILDRRYHVGRDDIRAVVHPTLRHRLLLNFEGQADGVRPDAILDRVLDAVERAPVRPLGAREQPTVTEERPAVPRP
jgi:MoxR-like ATPase